MNRSISFRVAIKSPNWDADVRHSDGWLVSANSFTIGAFWERVIDLEFSDGGTQPFGDINWATDKVVYLQSTGMKDSKCQEIYEKDICKVSGGWSGTVDAQEMYELNNFHFWDEVRQNIESGASYEVTGNVYENPELLQGGR